MLPNINFEVRDTVLCSSDWLKRFRIRPISLHGNFVIRIERDFKISESIFRTWREIKNER